MLPANCKLYVFLCTFVKRMDCAVTWLYPTGLYMPYMSDTIISPAPVSIALIEKFSPPYTFYLFSTMKYRWRVRIFNNVLQFRGCSFEDEVKRKGRRGVRCGRYDSAKVRPEEKKLNKTALIIRRDVEEWNFYYVGMNETSD